MYENVWVRFGSDDALCALSAYSSTDLGNNALPVRCVRNANNCGNGTLETGEQCDDGNTNNNDGCSANCELENGFFCYGLNECVFQDTSSMMIWQGCLAGQSGSECTGTTLTKNFIDAITYCDDLSWGGHHDWQLPNVDKLRTLVRGCNVTMSNGTCDITHQCASNVEGTADCNVAQCIGCDNNPGPSPGGCYLPNELPGTSCAESLWSSSKYSDSLSYYLWTGAAHVDSANNSYEYRMRCVRAP